MKTIAESSGRMHNPPHPGEVLKELCMEPLEITVTKAAEALGVSRKHLSAVVNGRTPITPDMAVRIGTAFDTDAEFWLRMQMDHDLWQVRHRARPKVKRLDLA